MILNIKFSNKFKNKVISLMLQLFTAKFLKIYMIILYYKKYRYLIKN